MIKSFRSTAKGKALKVLFDRGTSAKVAANLHQRCIECLDVLEAASGPEDLNLPGYQFHPLQGTRRNEPVRYSVHVNGPWCITFEFEDGDAYRVDLEQYH